MSNLEGNKDEWEHERGNAVVMKSGGGFGIFIWGGGGAQEIMCPHPHYERGTELTFDRGPDPA